MAIIRIPIPAGVPGSVDVDIPGGTGDPDTQAYFGGDGILTDDVNATMTPTDWQLRDGADVNAARVNRVKHSLSIGSGSSATGESASAQGLDCVASGAQAHAEGLQTAAGGIGAHTEGQSTIASTGATHAEGYQAQATAFAAHAEGQDTRASGLASHASGYRSAAILSGQLAHSSGPGNSGTTDPGATQATLLTLGGRTPGGAPGETTGLTLGPANGGALTLEDGKGYVVVVTTIARGLIGVAKTVRSWKWSLVLRKDGGTTTIAAQGAVEQLGDAGGATWTLVATIDVGPDALLLTFTTGATTAATKITAKVEMVEISTL